MRLIYKIDLALCLNHFRGCPDSSVGKESAYNAETLVQSLGQEDPMEGNSNLLEYSGLENSMDCIVHGITKSQTELSDFHFTLNYFTGTIEIQVKIIKGSYQQMF